MEFEFQTIHRVCFSCTTNGDAADDYNDALVRLAKQFSTVYFNNDSRYMWKWCWIFECENRDTLNEILKAATVLADMQGVVLTNELG
ncbi:hypothetical protein [Stenotrophomonas phage RAS14]